MSALSPELNVIHVPLAQLHPNPWNPNVQDERTYEAERESIRAYGFIDPVTVRAHPAIDGEYQIIDGEHRVRGANDEGIDEVPVVVLKLDDPQAKKLTVILNETRGDADPVPLSRLLADIRASSDSMAALMVGLPYREPELEHLLALGMTDWDTFDASRSQEIDDYLKDQQGATSSVMLTYSLADHEKFERAVRLLKHEWSIDEQPGVVLRAVEEAVERARGEKRG